MSPLRVAVVVPCRNTPTLARCLQALQAGQRIPDELVVVDDGSQPPVEAPSGVRVVRQAALGPAHARNRGAALSDADVLLFVDADVVVAPNTLRLLLEHLATHPQVSGVQAVYARAQGPFAARLSNALQRFQMRRVAKQPLAGLSSYCSALRREAFAAAGGFDEALNRPTVEDDNLGLRLAAAGHRLEVVVDAEVTHLATPGLVGLLARMRRMAHDRAATLDVWWAHRPPRGTATHHPRAQLVAAALAGGAWVMPLVAPGLLGLSVVVQYELLHTLWRDEGPAFTARAALVLPALSTAAALGVATGVGQLAAGRATEAAARVGGWSRPPGVRP